MRSRSIHEATRPDGGHQRHGHSHSGSPARHKNLKSGSTARRLTMRMFDVQGIEIVASRDQVFEFVRKPGNLPRWAQAFVSAGDGRARLETPSGAVDIALDVSADAEAGTVDWRLAFPHGGGGVAQARGTQ